jgi:hypothetical protein
MDYNGRYPGWKVNGEAAGELFDLALEVARNPP